MLTGSDNNYKTLPDLPEPDSPQLESAAQLRANVARESPDITDVLFDPSFSTKSLNLYGRAASAVPSLNLSAIYPLNPDPSKKNPPKIVMTPTTAAGSPPSVPHTSGEGEPIPSLSAFNTPKCRTGPDLPLPRPHKLSVGSISGKITRVIFQ